MAPLGTHYTIVVDWQWLVKLLQIEAYFRAISRLAMQKAAAVLRSIMRLCEDINSKFDRENGPN